MLGRDAYLIAMDVASVLRGCPPIFQVHLKAGIRSCRALANSDSLFATLEGTLFLVPEVLCDERND